MTTKPMMIKMTNFYQTTEAYNGNFGEYSEQEQDPTIDDYSNIVYNSTDRWQYNIVAQEESNDIYVDKSATYFDDPKVAQRAHSLLPNAYIIIILIDPADRAYSWYQHQRAHGDLLAKEKSFEEIIKAKDDDSSSHELRTIRNRCLMPGFYSQHLNRWLELYPSRQIIIIDGQWLKLNPGAVMNRLQLILRVKEPLEYRKLLTYSKSKGFFCVKTSNARGRLKCLGSGKGRRYPPMSRDARLYLNRLYLKHNQQLAKILTDIGQALPNWLEEATSRINSVIFN